MARHRRPWLVIALLLASGPAFAQSGPPSAAAQADAQRAMEKGLEAKQKGNVAEALAQYQKASLLVPEANLPHRFAGDALVALERWDEAVTEYETYLRIKPGVQDGAALRKRIDEIRMQHIEGTLDVECTPEGASVFVDDAKKPAGVTPLRGLRLHAGPHRVRLEADGYRPGTWTNPINAGSSRTLQCSLDRTSAPAGATAAVPAADKPGAPGKSHGVLGSWWFWTGVGVVVAGATVTAVALASSGSSADPPHTDGGAIHFK